MLSRLWKRSSKLGQIYWESFIQEHMILDELFSLLEQVI